MRRGTLAWCGVAALGLGGVVLISRPGRDAVRCGAGFRAEGARCVAETSCPSPLAVANGRCDAPALRVAVPRTRVFVGPSDWEAEGKVAPRLVEAGPFWMDAFEASRESFAGHAEEDPLRAASGMTRAEAADHCQRHAGRLPSEDEWLVAAAGALGDRYPWGQTGAVCRRAAFGLAVGPCSRQGVGPDTVGAHGAGDTALGIHDLAGNVAEWMAADPGAPDRGVAKGGSWRSELATELRVWARLEVDPGSHDDRVGVRCVHDAP